jgi:transposase
MPRRPRRCSRRPSTAACRGRSSPEQRDRRTVVEHVKAVLGRREPLAQLRLVELVTTEPSAASVRRVLAAVAACRASHRGPGCSSRATVDMRGSFDALAGQVRRMGLEPVDGSLYVFPSRRRLLAVLAFDGSGWCLFRKRLERGTFELPELPEGAARVALCGHVLATMLAGVPLGAPRRRCDRTETNTVIGCDHGGRGDSPVPARPTRRGSWRPTPARRVVGSGGDLGSGRQPPARWGQCTGALHAREQSAPGAAPAIAASSSPSHDRAPRRRSGSERCPG